MFYSASTIHGRYDCGIFLFPRDLHRSHDRGCGRDHSECNDVVQGTRSTTLDAAAVVVRPSVDRALHHDGRQRVARLDAARSGKHPLADDAIWGPTRLERGVVLDFLWYEKSRCRVDRNRSSISRNRVDNGQLRENFWDGKSALGSIPRMGHVRHFAEHRILVAKLIRFDVNEFRASSRQKLPFPNWLQVEPQDKPC